MPSITETLDRIAHEADQIKAHSKRSERPTGPITSAVLYLPNPYRPNASILSLIREATPAERRPFDVYAADDLQASGSGSGKRRDGDRTYQRVEPHQLTPLRNLRAQKGKPEELEATLYAAEEVINMLADGFHPMRRARKQVSDYFAQHEQNAGRIAELQGKLDSLSKSQAENKPKEKETAPALSIDEAILAEEEAVRALEASIAPLRRSAAVKAEAARSPPPKSTRVANSPVSATRKTSQTPKKAPPSPPKFAHATPKRVVPEPPPNSRFTPLHLFTPRARPTSLAPPGSTIVDRMRASITPAQASAYRNRTLPSSIPQEPTPVRLPDPEPLATPDRTDASLDEATPQGKSGPRTVEGVEVDLPYIKDATVGTWLMLG